MIIKTYRQDKIVSLFRHLGTKSKLNQKLCSLESKLSPIYEFKHQNNYLFLKHLMIGYLFYNNSLHYGQKKHIKRYSRN